MAERGCPVLNEIDTLTYRIHMAQGFQTHCRIVNDNRGARFWQRRVDGLYRARRRAGHRWAKQLNGVE